MQFPAASMGAAGRNRLSLCRGRKDVLTGAKKDRMAESYFVYECPEFEKG